MDRIIIVFYEIHMLGKLIQSNQLVLGLDNGVSAQSFFERLNEEFCRNTVSQVTGFSKTEIVNLRWGLFKKIKMINPKSMSILN